MRIFVWCLIIFGAAFNLSGPASAQGYAQLPGHSGVAYSIPKDKSYALLIGNDDYLNWANLKNAKKDARKVGQALEEHHGFKVEYGFDLSDYDMKKQILEFIQKRGRDRDARILIWFAGHGGTIRINDTEEFGYLAGIDAPPQREEAAVEAKTLRVSTMREWIHRMDARHVMVVFDSCFAGTVFDRMRSGGMGAFRTPPERWSNSVRHYITAGTAKQPVFDDGNFARIFVEAITGLGRVQPTLGRFLTGEDLGRYLHDEVSALRKKAQTPNQDSFAARHSGEHKGEFVFELPITTVRSSAMIAPLVSAQSGLASMAIRCLYGPIHRDARDVAVEVAQLANPDRNHIRHTFDAFQIEPVSRGLVLSDPHVVHAVTPRDGQIHVRYAENGQMILIPVEASGQSSPDDVGSYLLRGAWRRAGGLGCVEFTLNVRTRFGRGKVFDGNRARWREGLPYIGKKPLFTTLSIVPIIER